MGSSLLCNSNIDSFLVKGFLALFLWLTKCVVATRDNSEMSVVKLHCVLLVCLAWRLYFVIDEWAIVFWDSERERKPVCLSAGLWLRQPNAGTICSESICACLAYSMTFSGYTYVWLGWVFLGCVVVMKCSSGAYWGSSLVWIFFFFFFKKNVVGLKAVVVG